jgi:hypothetical protein
MKRYSRAVRLGAAITQEIAHRDIFYCVRKRTVFFLKNGSAISNLMLAKRLTLAMMYKLKQTV